MHCNANKDIVQPIVKQKQRKHEIAATLVFVYTQAIEQLTPVTSYCSGLTQNRFMLVCNLR